MRIAYYKCTLCGLPKRSEGECNACKDRSKEYLDALLKLKVLSDRWESRDKPLNLKCRADEYESGQRKKPEPMTLERAVAILNGRQHNYKASWSSSFDINETPRVCDAGRYWEFSSFEAIAIAEKYERESK